MWIQILLVIVSVFVILFGANFLTDGAAALAARLRIPQLIIGLTIVAFGTSAPELTVSVLGAIRGDAGISVGNVIGSNILNIFAVLGISAMINPLDVDRNSRRFDIPIALFASFLLVIILLDPVLDGRPSDVTRVESIVLVTMGLLFILYNIAMAKRSIRLKETDESQAKVVEKPIAQKPIWLIVVSIVGGLALLVWGSDLFVSNAAGLAVSFGVSETLIGLTIVSWGTSAPELATSIVAAIKKNSGIAVGNILGSNIFNVFFVLGITGTVRPLGGLEFTYLDLFMQFLGALLLLVFTLWINKQKLTRLEGTILSVLFVAYTIYIISAGLAQPAL